MKEHNLEAFYKYYSNATKEQAIEDMFLDNCNLQQEIERLNNIINKIRNWLEEDYKTTINNEICDYPRYYLDKFDEIVGSDKE